MLDRNIKYRDILIFVLIGLIGYKIIDNYTEVFNILGKGISICSPFIYSLLFAYILNPIMMVIEKRLKVKRGIAIFITYASIVGIIILFSIYVVPSIVDSIISITSEVPKYMEIVQGWINKALEDQNVYDLIKEVGLLDYISVISSKLGSILITILDGSISSIFEIASNLVKIIIGLLISVYVLLDKERILKGVRTITYMILKEKRADKIISLVRIYNKMIGIYVGTKALDSLIIGVLALIGLLIIKAPYAILIALVVGFTNMIPYFGPFVGEVVGAFVGIFVSPVMAISILIFLLALQQFDAWYLDPKLIGAKVGVRPIGLIVAITIGGGVFGPIGMLLASPTVATIKILYDRRVAKFKEAHEELIEKIDCPKTYKKDSDSKKEDKKS